MESALWNLVSIAVASLAARVYYVRAARDLEAETQRIRNLLRIALQAIISQYFNFD